MIIGSNLLFFENLPSTNTFTAGLLKEDNLREGTIVYTNFQTAGRGYLQNTWESEDGKNLLISVLLRPSFLNPTDQFLISMTVSLGICDFLLRFIPQCSIKWPNDIYVINDKIAGILIENSLIGEKIEYSISGIGLNINQERFSGGAPNPVSLHIITGNEYDLTSCLKKLAADLDKRYKQLIAGQTAELRDEYISRLYRLNEWSEFSDRNGRFTGRIIIAANEGGLIVERKDSKIIQYAFKEIEFIL